MTDAIDIRQDQLEIVKNILNRLLPDNIKVWVYGSRARWMTEDSSDLDLALEGEDKIDSQIIGEIHHEFEESDLPYKVDIVDMATIDDSFKKIIEKEKVFLKHREPVLKERKNKNWDSFFLLDVADIIGGGTPKTTIKEYWNGKVPWLTVADFNNNYRMVFNAEKKITKIGLENSSANLLSKGDIIISARGTVGCLAQTGGEMSFNQSCYGLRGKEEKILNDYLYYVLKLEVNKLKGMSYGSVFNTITTNTLKRLKVTIPTSILEQKRMSSILVALDDKIQLNLQINKILEQIAQTIFKSWFVDFDPVHAKKKALEKGLSKEQAERAAMAVISGICSPSDFAENFKEMNQRLSQKLSKMSKKNQEELAHTASLFPSEFQDSKLGEIPRGWRLGELKDEIEFNPKLSVKQSSIAKYVDMKSLPTSGHRIDCVLEREFKSGSKFQNGDILMARITPCLENGKAAYVDCLEKGEVAWGSTEFIVMRSKGKLPNYWIYLLSRNHSFVNFAISNMSGTSGRQRVPSSVLETYKFVFCDNELLSKFEYVVHSFEEEIKLNSEENQTLENLRDIILPKLLAGEIDLSNIKLDKDVRSA